jgi:ABC-type glycerol-3-phosphate transport system substrate-binding protein
MPAIEVGGANFVILAHSSKAQQKAAWQFIDWFTQPEQNAEWAMATGYLPIHQQSFQSPRYVEYMKSQPGIEIITSQRDHAYPHTSAPYYPNLLPHLLDTVNESLRGNRTPEDSLSKLQRIAVQLAADF